MFGGIGGLFFGIMSASNAKNRSKRAEKAGGQAQSIRLQQQTMANAITRRDFIRNFRLQQAQAIVASSTDNTSSSLTAGAISSLGAQAAGNLDYFAKQGRLDEEFTRWNKLAGGYATSAANWATFAQQASAIGQGIDNIYNTLTTPRTPPQSLGGNAGTWNPNSSVSATQTATYNTSGINQNLTITGK